MPVHQQRDQCPAEEHDRRAHAQGLELLHGGLDVVAVAGHAGDEARQAEGVKLAAAEIRGFAKELLPHVVADFVSVADGHPVGGDVELPAEDGCGEHAEAPEDHAAHLPQGDDIVDDVLQYVGERQLRHGAEELDQDGQGDPAPIPAKLAKDQFHTGLRFRLFIAAKHRGNPESTVCSEQNAVCCFTLSYSAFPAQGIFRIRVK